MNKTPSISYFFLFLLGVIHYGCQDHQDYYHINDFKLVDKVDAHVHLNTSNQYLIEQGLADNMRMITINTDAWQELPITEQQVIALKLAEAHPDQLAYIASFSMDGWENTQEWQNRTIEFIADAVDIGAAGVKVWKNIGLVLRDSEGRFLMIDDPVFDPVFEYLSNEGIPLYGHIGEPRNTWLPLEEMTVAQDRDYFAGHPEYHMFLNPEYPAYEDIIEARNSMLDKNPGLVFVGCHLGSMEWSIEMMADHLEKYPNMIYDMAHRVPHLQHLAQRDREKVREFFLAYQDRLIYSTDIQHYEDSDIDDLDSLVRNTWSEDWEFFVTDNEMDNFQFEGSFTGLKLPKVVVDKLYLENVRKWIPSTGF